MTWESEQTLPKLDAYRQSLIAAFDSCPRRALYALLNQQRSSPLAARGTLFHRFHHKAINEMIAQKEPRMSVEQGLEILSEVILQRDIPPEEIVPLSMRDLRWLRVLVVKWCETMELSVDRMLPPEQRLFMDLTLPTGEVLRVTGQLDTLIAGPGEDQATSLDAKSGWARPSRSRSQGDEPDQEGESGLTALGWVQSLVYAMLVFANFPSINVFTFREWHVLWAESREVTIQRWEAERMQDVLAAQVSLLHEAVLAGPDSPRWVASPGAHCALCSGRRHCPIRRQVGIPADEEEARQMAGEWVLAAEIRKERAVMLKGFVDAHGPIEVAHSHGRRFVGWDYSPDGSRSFTVFEAKPVAGAAVPESLEAAAREAGVLSDE
jgi:hypothetical protein